MDRKDMTVGMKVKSRALVYRNRETEWEPGIITEIPTSYYSLVTIDNGSRTVYRVDSEIKYDDS